MKKFRITFDLIATDQVMADDIFLTRSDEAEGYVIHGPNFLHYLDVENYHCNEANTSKNEYLSSCCQAPIRSLKCENCKESKFPCISICTNCGADVTDDCFTSEDYNSIQADSQINLQKDENNHG